MKKEGEKMNKIQIYIFLFAVVNRYLMSTFGLKYKNKRKGIFDTVWGCAYKASYFNFF